MSIVSDDRWTCPHPSCQQTVLFWAANPSDRQIQRISVQKTHSAEHSSARKSRKNPRKAS